MLPRGLFTGVTRARYLRRVSRDLARIASTLEAQTALVARLVDRLAPVDPPTERATLNAETGVSYLDPLDAALAQTYVTRTLAETGHLPSDEEIVLYLGDEKTVDLHTRLTERAAEVERLAETRA
jgi:hypothetical protein